MHPYVIRFGLKMISTRVLCGTSILCMYVCIYIYIHMRMCVYIYMYFMVTMDPPLLLVRYHPHKSKCEIIVNLQCFFGFNKKEVQKHGKFPITSMISMIFWISQNGAPGLHLLAKMQDHRQFAMILWISQKKCEHRTHCKFTEFFGFHKKKVQKHRKFTMSLLSRKSWTSLESL